MAYVYKLTESQTADETGTLHKSFGISVFESSALSPIKTVDDITSDRAVASELVSLCNRLQLSYEHIDDVVADILAEV